LKLFYKNKGKKPLDLRPKRTRAIRRNKKLALRPTLTTAQKKREQNFPKRRFAVKA
jgi:large subunit ribosomal protein L35e